mgnify:CR=1 FL=1
MPIPQNTGSAWSYHWEPKVEHKLEPEKAKAPHTTVSHIEGASLIKSCFNDAYYVMEEGGFLVVLKQLKKQAELLKDGQNAIRKNSRLLENRYKQRH